MSRIILSIGHHDNDPGAVANSTTEHNEIKFLVNQAFLELKNRGIDCYIVPTNLNLTQKVHWINSNFSSNDFCIEFHIDAASNPNASGSSVWYCAGKETEKSIAEYFSSILSLRLHLSNRGFFKDTDNRHGRLAIVRDTIPHAWLFEMGFLTNVSDLQNLRQRGKNAIVECCVDFLLGGNPLIKEDDKWYFRDVPKNHFAFNAIKKAKLRGVVKGYSDNTFKPNASISRAELLVILDRLGMLDG